MSTIGLLGGTFNPIHFGHLRMAEEMAESLNLAEVRFMPSANPPHKSIPMIDAEHRAAMVVLGIANNPNFKLDNRELHRIGPSYTFDTLQSLRKEVGTQNSLILMMGSDAFASFNTWHRWENIIELCHILLVQRPQKKNEIALPKSLEILLTNHYTENCRDLDESQSGYISMKPMTPLDISSTAIRHAIQNKHSVRYLMPDSVIDYIQTHNLYTKDFL